MIQAERMVLDQILAPVREELATVTERTLSRLADPVARKVVYLIAAGGKRLRPALVLLAGVSGPSPERAALIDTATAVELIHTATLIHDDIIDESPLRRSQPSFHHRWGRERAVLMGDYLYATAFTMLSHLHQPAVMQVMSQVCQELCRGELREVEARFRLDLTERDYVEIIRDKTASLIGGCCRAGAVLGGCDPAAVTQLTEFGINFGLAFQIIDDCLDLVGDQEQLGKAVLADMDKGALSLPMIYLTQTMIPRERDELFAPLREHGTDPAFLARVAEAAIASGAVRRAQERAEGLARVAQESLAHAPLNGMAEVFQQLADYAVSRRS